MRARLLLFPIRWASRIALAAAVIVSVPFADRPSEAMPTHSGAEAPAAPPRASFYPAGDIRLLNVDLGHFHPGEEARAHLEIFNLASELARVAPLSVSRIEGLGDIERITIDLVPFDGLQAGASKRFLAVLDTSAPGRFNATFTLHYGDAAGEGDAVDSTMTIRIIATVLAPADPPPTATSGDLSEPGTLIFLSTAGAGLIALSHLSRRRRLRRGS